MHKNFGAVLKTLRKQQNLSQECLAFNSSLDRTYISILERDIKKPGYDTIIALSAGLGIKASELFKHLEEHD
ncbi:helix-turn-helix transcriptional regulator [Neobacillus cucumis]|nr:helix-turn-helix transcriptional regulator [Neobacillus cucumis]